MLTGSDDRIDVECRFRRFAQGATIVINNLERHLAELTATDTAEMIDRQADAFVASRPAIPSSRLSALLTPPEITMNTRLGAWPDLIFRLVTDDETVRVIWQGPNLVLPSFTAADVRFALTTLSFTVHDLPADLDQAGQLVLMRRLCREGLIRAG